MPAPFQPIKLTPVQQKRWDQARTAFLWAQPAFADVWYNLMVDNNGETAFFTDDPKVPVAGTDGRYLYLNPKDFLDKRTLDERVFILGHEVLHAILDHPRVTLALKRAGKVTFSDGTSLPWDEQVAQRAADMLINDMLHNARVGTKPSDALHEPRVINENMSLFDAYRVAFKRKPGGGQKSGKPGEGKGEGQGQGEGQAPGQGEGENQGFDTHMEPGAGQGKSPDEAAAERNEAEWQTGVAAALESARQRGKLPGNIERLLLKVLNPEVDWKEKLRSTLARRLGNSGSTWNQLDENLIHRGIGAPGRVSFGAGRVVVAWDTSGSMTQRDMDKGATETAGIIADVRPRRLSVLQCDAQITDQFECDDEDDLKRVKIKGGGGTDFRPVFDWIDADGERPDALIYFTDTYGTFPHVQPDYPVIWVCLLPGTTVPWGDQIFAPIKQRDYAQE